MSSASTTSSTSALSAANALINISDEERFRAITEQPDSQTV